MTWNGKLPYHIAIILDGNRRWADIKGISRKNVINYGIVKVEEILFNWGERFKNEYKTTPFKQLTIYALTLNNIQNRPQVELKEEISHVKSSGEFEHYQICVKFGGKRSSLPQNLAKAMGELEMLTKNYTTYNFFIPIAYDGNEEIQDAVKHSALLKNQFENNLYFPEAKPIDMMIRTGGEMRLSGFMLWYIGQAELFFPKTLAEDFTYEEFESLLREYSLRDRRFGK
jgi:tritrans,polycis-undecaprenyl-diphosphate synthase [geranylgeranyl-diphosphate specific]